MALFLPERLDLRFEGFSAESFEVLARLRLRPSVDQYRLEKDAVANYVMGPFKQFRDDLVVNLVLPNHLSLETEKNVFSRLLKNDFGAGGCHSHIWMSFYRPGYTRLSDFQPFHAITHDSFLCGLHAGGRDPSIARAACAALLADVPSALADLNRLLKAGEWTFSVESASGGKKFASTGELEAFPDWIARARHLSIYRTFPRDKVISWRGNLIRYAIRATADIWPLYQAFTRMHGMAR